MAPPGESNWHEALRARECWIVQVIIQMTVETLNHERREVTVPEVLAELTRRDV